MKLEDFIGFLFIVLVGFLAMAGVAHMVGDYRHFDQIVRDCKERGFIQNENIRMKCVVEDVMSVGSVSSEQ